MEIKPLEGTDMNRAFLALNHYISTGAAIGEGVAIEDVNTPGGDAVNFLIAHRPADQDDRDN